MMGLAANGLREETNGSVLLEQAHFLYNGE